jgi:hypothetical protein
VTLLVPTLLSCRQIVGIHPAPPSGPASGCDDPAMIDDMEDGDGNICQTEASGKRHGSWVTLGDGSSGSTLEPAQERVFLPEEISGGRGPASHLAAHFHGSGFTEWGALLGFVLNDGHGLSLDLSRAGGITFFMKSNVAVSVNFRIPETVLPSLGGACADSPTALNCNNNFEFRISAPLKPDDWIEYKVPFSSLAQVVQGPPRNPRFGTATWNPNLVGVDFQVDPGAAFDVWIDDVAFYRCLLTDCVATCPDSAPQSCWAKGLSPAACWPVGTDCAKDLPTCSDPVAPSGCPANGDFPAGCGRTGTDCFTNRYFGVWAAGEDAWAVGSRGAIVHGTRTASSVVPKSGTTEDLLGVWASGPKDVWAVGLRGAVVRSTGIGTPWIASNSGTPRHLESVWGSRPADVWAVGAGGTIVHWDGSSWSPPPRGSSTTQDLFAVWGSAYDDVWAVGFGGAIVHWDGTSWSPSPSVTTELLLGVWGSASDDVWAVGHLGTIVHWNGIEWASGPVSMTNQVLHGVWGSAPDDVWIVGDGGVLLHGNGRTWSPWATGMSQSLQAIRGTGPHDVWAVGFGDAILHWDGSEWRDPRK